MFNCTENLPCMWHGYFDGCTNIWQYSEQAPKVFKAVFTKASFVQWKSKCSYMVFALLYFVLKKLIIQL